MASPRTNIKRKTVPPTTSSTSLSRANSAKPTRQKTQPLLTSQTLESESEASEDDSDDSEKETHTQKLEREVAGLRSKELDLERELRDMEKLWARRRLVLTDELSDLRSHLIKLDADLLLAIASEAEEAPPGPPSLSWVDGPVYTCACSLVILINLLLMILEMKDEKMTKRLYDVDQIFLGWYLLEVCAKFCYHQKRYLFGDVRVVWWNWLDLGIVVSGVIDQWAVPLVTMFSPVDTGGSNEGSHGPQLARFLRAFRLLRVFRIMRILKIGKYFLQTDLSWVERPTFQSFIMGIIMLNTITMGLELDIPWSGWFWMEHVLLAIYVFELSVRLKQNGWDFFTDEDWIWNNLDFLIVSTAVAEQWFMPIYNLIKEMVTHSTGSDEVVRHVMKLLRVLRLLRILRLARLMRKIKPLYKLIEGIAQAMQGMQWVLVLTFVVLYAFAIFATSLVGHGLLGGFKASSAAVFGTVSESMFSLFKVMNAEVSVMAPLMKTTPITRFFFVLFMVISNWMILATLTAVVSENMITVSRQQEEAESFEQEEIARVYATSRLKLLFEEVDADGSRTIDEHEFRTLMKNTTLRDELCDATCLGVADLEDLFAFLSMEDDHGVQRIQYESFIEQLGREARQVSERSIFRLEKRLRLHEKKMASHVKLVESSFTDVLDGLLLLMQSKGITPKSLMETRNGVRSSLAIASELLMNLDGEESWEEI